MEKVEAVSPHHDRPTATAQPFSLTEDHQLNLTPDLRIEGDYDMRRFVDAYAIADLSGLKVLDVGTGAGAHERRPTSVLDTARGYDRLCSLNVNNLR